MAFIGLVFAQIVLTLLTIDLILTLTFFILAIVFKIFGKKRKSRKMKIAGNVFLVPGFIFSIPLLAVGGYLIYNVTFKEVEVTLPDGETKYVTKWDISTIESYAKNPDENSINALDKLLDKNSALVFYHDVNHESILDDGLEQGNADIVRIALEHGAIFDDPVRYEHMAYVASSMEDYLGDCSGRAITEDDIEIVEMMFENNASTALKNPRIDSIYSNVFGKAVWVVLYNDESVTDTELDFLQVFIDHGFSSDRWLLLAEEAPVGYSFSDEYYEKTKDSNYDRLMEIIGK